METKMKLVKLNNEKPLKTDLSFFELMKKAATTKKEDVDKAIRANKTNNFKYGIIIYKK